MRSFLLVAAALILLAVVTGCSIGAGVRGGFGYVAPSIIYAGGVQGGASEPNLEIIKRPYRHVRRVTGEASQTNVLMLVTFGDASIEKAQNDALIRAAGADALINRNFDVSQLSILGLFSTATLRVSGDAIKYTDNK